MKELLEKYHLDEDQYGNIYEHFHDLIMAVKIEREVSTSTEGEIHIELYPDRANVDDIISDIFATLEENGIKIEMP